MKTLTLLVFAISCSFLQLSGSIETTDVIRAAFPNELSSKAKNCLKRIVVQWSMAMDPRCFEIFGGPGMNRRGLQTLRLNPYEIDDVFKKLYFRLSLTFNLDAKKAKMAEACLTQYRNHAQNLTSCLSGLGANSEADLKKGYDEYMGYLCDNPLAGQIINCQREKDPPPQNYKYQALSTNGVNCATNVFGNSRQPQELDKHWLVLLTEFGYYYWGHSTATWPIRYCFHDPSGELMKEAAKPEDQRFKNKENCIKKYVGVSGLKDLKAIIKRFADNLDPWTSKLAIIECALKE